MTNGYYLDTTEEVIPQAAWARELADIAPVLDNMADRQAFDRLKAIRDAIASSISGMPEAITGLELADNVLTSGDDERLNAMDQLLFWAEDHVPLDVYDEWVEFDPPPLEWVIHGWLPAGRIGLLSGQGGRGKSRLALQIAAAMAAGESDFLGGPSTAHGSERGGVQGGSQTVVYASWEDDRDEVARRLSAFATAHNYCEGAHSQGSPFSMNMKSLGRRLKYVDMAGEGPVWGPPPGAHISTMGQITPGGSKLRELAEQSGARLLVLDPLAACFASNENDRGLVRAFLSNWDRWGRNNTCSVLVLSHPPKGTGLTYSGSTDWEAGPRFMWTLTYKKRAEGEEARPVLTLEKANYGRKGARIWLEICDKGVWAEAPTGGDDGESEEYDRV